MARLLILIIALNAFIPPVFATGGCDMMDESNSMMMSASQTMSDMDCCEDVAKACASSACASDCAATTAPSLLTSECQKNITVAGHHSPIQSGLAYFYKIILPVNTPPPLV